MRTYSTTKETRIHGDPSRHALISVRFMSTSMTKQADVSSLNGWTERSGMPKMNLLSAKMTSSRLWPHPASKVYLPSKRWMAKTIIAMQVSSQSHRSTTITLATRQQSQTQFIYKISSGRFSRLYGVLLVASSFCLSY